MEVGLGRSIFGKPGVVAVLGLFVALGVVRFSSGDGDDLSASYVGCKVVASGNAGHLYAHDPVDFSEIGKDAVWASMADAADFEGTLHPYVQTPLWAYGLGPLCTRMNFPWFERVFAAIEMLCFAGSIWAIATQWAPSLLNTFGMIVVVTALWFSIPYQYAMVLMQTHVLFFAMTIAALILAERRRPGWAGLLLAGAAAVKLTPGVLVAYWLLAGRWKAAASTVVWSVVIAGVTWLAVGQGLTATYLAELHRISRVLLPAMNNQSLAAWWMGRFYPVTALTDMVMLPLPAALRLGSAALMLGMAALGGWIDRRHEGAPLGAMIGLVAATVFAPIAWTHYSIVMIAPLMVLWQENRRARSGRVWGAMAAIVLLNYRPLAADVLGWKDGRYSLVRSEFYAYVICLGVMTYCGWRRGMRAEIARIASRKISGDVARLSTAA